MIPKRVRDLMTTDVVTLDRNDKLLVADDVMRLGRIRHLPILDEDGQLAGLISQRDLFHSGLLKALGYGTRAAGQALDMVAVKDAMRTEVAMTAPDTLLRDAARTMRERKIGCLVVMEGERIAGILTESDFVKYVAELAAP
jgi:CBS domain-containing protein